MARGVANKVWAFWILVFNAKAKMAMAPRYAVDVQSWRHDEKKLPESSFF
jgi:hypothetical protein